MKTSSILLHHWVAHPLAGFCWACGSLCQDQKSILWWNTKGDIIHEWWSEE